MSRAASFGGIMVFSMFLSRALGMLRDTVLAYRFGLTLDSDSYQIAVRVPDMVFMLVAGGGLSSAFIPVFSEFIHRDKPREAWKVFSVVVCACTIAALALIGIAWALTPAIVGYFSVGKDPAIVPAAIHMSRILLPAQFAFLVGSILLATLYARKKFLAPGLAPNVYNVGIILGALILPAALGLGVESMAWGGLVGAFIGNLVLPTFAMIREGSSFKPSLNLRTPGVDRFFSLMLPVVLGFSLPSMVTLITQAFASRYGGKGINTDFQLANNLMQAPLGIFGQGLALAIFPVLSEFVAKGRMDLYRTQVSKTIRTVLYLGIPSGALMTALAPLIVHALYGYGVAAKDPKNLSATSDLLRIYSVAIFAWCVQPVLMRGFFSLHKTFKPIAVSTLFTLAFIALCAYALRVSPDYRLIAAATDVASCLLAIALYFALERDVGRLDRGGILATLLLCGAAAAVSGGAVFGIMSVWRPAGKAAEICSVLILATVGAWIYYFATRLMKVPETEYVDRLVARVSRRAKPQE